MENSNNGMEFDELERLLGDIPHVASEQVQVEESTLNRLPSTSISSNSFEGFSIDKFQGNGNLIARNNLSMQNSHDHVLENTMPRNQPLTFAFGNLSLGDMVKDETPELLQRDNLNKQLFNFDTSRLSDFNSSNYMTGGNQDFLMTRLAPQNSASSRAVSEEYNKWQVGRLRPFETSFPSIHLGQDMANGYVPNQRVSTNGRPPLPYIQPQQIDHCQIPLNPIKDEQFYRMQGQYPHLQDLYNRQLESMLPLQLCENPMNRNSCQLLEEQCFGVPTSNHLVRSNHGPLQKTYGIRRGSNHLNSAFPPEYMNATQDMERFWQSSPGKFISTSHGVNTTDAWSVDANRSLNYANRIRAVQPNGCVRHCCFSSPTECSCHDDFNLSPLFYDSRYLKSHQNFNSIDEATGKIYLLAKDQHGCRFLQRKFVEGTRKDLEKIFKEIIDHVVELMTDPFGNYLMQKLLEVCDEDQRLQILHMITRKRGELVRISCNMHGTRVIQKVIETLKTQDQISMVVSALKAGAVTLMNDVNGNHVAQHCLRFLMPRYCEFLYDAARNCYMELATDRHGCCVLQRCISCSNDSQQHSMICKIIQNALVIAQDQYGNYVVQFILKLQISWATADIIKELEGNFGDLSLQKYSSNVVEKCILHGDKDHVTKIIDELINDPQFDKIMQDPYGNYISQTALRQTEGPQRAKLVNAIRPHVPALRTSPYGKRVLALLGKSY